jgi:predicted DNA-binding protein
MIRTQIQLSEEQSRSLKALAAREGKSVAELIRLSVDAMLATAGVIDEAEKRRRALAVVGRFRTGESDLAEAHDRYLAEAYQQ